jgi:hypothetical protein
VLEGVIKGLLGTASDTIGGLLTLKSVVSVATGNDDDDSDDEPAQGVNTRIGEGDPIPWKPNDNDDWTTDWSRRRNVTLGTIGEPSAFVAVHEVPISFSEEVSGTEAVVRGVWKSNHDIDGSDANKNTLDTLRLVTEVNSSEVPAR